MQFVEQLPIVRLKLFLPYTASQAFRHIASARASSVQSQMAKLTDLDLLLVEHNSY